MTPAQTRAQGLVTPSLSQLWLTAMLRMLAELALHVASTLRMCFRRPVVIGARQMPEALPAEKTDTQFEETTTVAASDHDDDPMIIITFGSGSPIRVPREGGNPATPSNLVLHRSFKAEQASQLAPDPRLRGGRGRESSTNKNAAA